MLTVEFKSRESEKNPRGEALSVRAASANEKRAWAGCALVPQCSISQSSFKMNDATRSTATQNSVSTDHVSGRRAVKARVVKRSP